MSAVLQMMAMGSFLAENVVGDSELIRLVEDKQSEDSAPGMTLYSVFSHEALRAWYRNGLPRVHLGHKHAASLMATQTKAESISDARPPWDSFAIDVPRGLIDVFDPAGALRIVDTIILRTGPTRVGRYELTVGEGNGVPAGVHMDIYDKDARLFAGVARSSVAGLGSLKHTVPFVELAARLALGVCMEMTSTTYKGGSLRPQPVKRDPRSGEPRTWTFQLTRDVKVDCRDAVRAYSQGKTHASPSVQTLVRGHWKQQVCGKGGSERKNMFIEPYWRGPEDAHIALRKHDVKHADDTQQENSQ